MEYAGEAATPRFGAGSFQIALNSLFESVAGRKLESVVYGKPHTRTYEYVEKVFRRHSPSVEELWGVGDQPETDIRGANNAGPHWQSALVGTGMWTGEGNSVRPCGPRRCRCFSCGEVDFEEDVNTCAGLGGIADPLLNLHALHTYSRYMYSYGCDGCVTRVKRDGCIG